jgi:hypothetical protein
MTESFMTDPTDLLIERLLRAAHDQGVEEGPDVEADDLQEMLRAARALLSTELCVAFFRRPEITTPRKIPEFEHFRQDRGWRTAMTQWNDKQLAFAGIDKRRLKALVRHRRDR